jgi:hexokinase
MAHPRAFEEGQSRGFAWIGDCIAEVVAESLTSDATKKDIPAELDMGITFSFPIMSVQPLDRIGVQRAFAICYPTPAWYAQC